MIEIVVGIISGIISGTGMGGGTILILFLSAFAGIEQHIAQATNIIFFIPTAVASIIVSAKQNLINFKICIVIALSGIIGALIGAKTANIIDTTILKKIFGVFLGIIAIYETICYFKEYISKRKTHNKNKRRNI